MTELDQPIVSRSNQPILYSPSANSHCEATDRDRPDMASVTAVAEWPVGRSILTNSPQPCYDCCVPETVNPDDKPIYEALREAREANVPKAIPYAAELRIRDVTSANLIAQFMAKLDAQNAKLDAQNAKLDAFSSAQNFQLRTIMWTIGAAVALIGIIVRLWG